MVLQGVVLVVCSWWYLAQQAEPLAPKVCISTYVQYELLRRAPIKRQHRLPGTLNTAPGEYILVFFRWSFV